MDQTQTIDPADYGWSPPFQVHFGHGDYQYFDDALEALVFNEDQRGGTITDDDFDGAPDAGPAKHITPDELTEEDYAVFEDALANARTETN